MSMLKNFTASLSKEGGFYIAQCVEVDVASHGATEKEAIQNLKEAMELHFESPVATIFPELKTFQADIGVA